MKIQTILSSLLCFFACISCSTTKLTRQNEAAESKAWICILDEDFSDIKLSNWKVWKGGAFNNEIQYYNQEQLKIKDGILTIQTQRKDVIGATSIEDASLKKFQYVSGRIETRQKYGPSQKTGHEEYRFMACIKMPKGNGIWPAFWSYGDLWPTHGEIDIIEARGQRPREFSSNIFYGTQPNVPLTKNDETTITDYKLNIDITQDYHIYELLWSKSELSILLDGELLKKYKANQDNYIESLFGKKHKLVLNTAVGGLFFKKENLPSTFANYAEMKVDWVKVYRR